MQRQRTRTIALLIWVAAGLHLPASCDAEQGRDMAGAQHALSPDGGLVQQLLALEEEKPPEDQAKQSEENPGVLPFDQESLITTLAVPPSSTAEDQFILGLTPDLAAQVLGAQDFVVLLDDGQRIKAESGEFTFSVDRAGGQVAIMSRSPGFGTEPAPVDESAILAQATDTLLALGMASNEIFNPHVRPLMAAGWDRTTGEKHVEKLAYKVFISRTLGGVEEPYSHLTLSYTLDGSFYKLIGKWLPVVPGNATIEAEMSQEEAAAYLATKLPQVPGWEGRSGEAFFGNVVVPQAQTESGYMFKLAFKVGFTMGGPDGHDGPVVDRFIAYDGEIL